MLARYHASQQARFLSVDPAAESAKAELPQTWNRYSYAHNSPVVLVDPDGEDPLTFAQTLTNAAISFFSSLRDQGEGYVSGGLTATGADQLAPGGLSGIPSQGNTDFQAGQLVGETLASVDTVVEVSVSADIPGTGLSGTAGVSVVNASDTYAFAGPAVTTSPSPVSVTITSGVVVNYQGAGSFSGQFVSATTSSPIGVTASGNPGNPEGPAMIGISVSTDVGGPTQTWTRYTHLNEEER